jgi:hypothetical protein
LGCFFPNPSEKKTSAQSPGEKMKPKNPLPPPLRPPFPHEHTDCSAGFGLAPFVYGKSKKPKLMVCAPCPGGTWSLGGTYSTTLCQRCPVGSTTSVPFGASDILDCDECLPGFAGDPCALCPAGTFAAEDGSECIDCSDDGSLTTPKAGSTSEDQCYIAVCDVDEQSVKGECYPCAENYFSEPVRR